MMRLLVCYCNTRSLSLSLSYAVALRVTKGVIFKYNKPHAASRE